MVGLEAPDVVQIRRGFVGRRENGEDAVESLVEGADLLCGNASEIRGERGK